MFPIEKVLNKFILFGCFVLASYFTTIQFITYGKNEDLSVLSYRKFNSEPKDQYPELTVCLRSLFGHIFKKSSHLWTPKLITPRTYKKFLSGYLKPKNKSEDILNTFSGIQFDEVAVDFLRDIKLGFHTFTRKEIYLRYKECYLIENGECPSPPLLKSYQDPQTICYSRKFYYGKDDDLAQDVLKLNLSKLVEMRLGVQIYIHAGGQLMRHLSNTNNPAVSEMDRGYLKNLFNEHSSRLIHEITYDLDDVVVLRKRENGIIKCNESLLDEDQMWRYIIGKTIGCLPAYWITLASNLYLEKNFSNCSPDQYRNITELSRSRYFTNISKLYINPCTEMKRVVSTKIVNTVTGFPNEFEVRLTLKYDNERYMEIKSNEAFNGETLLSSVGGYIGIFLGFSILQVSQIFISAISFAQTYLKDRRNATFHANQQLQVNNHREENAATAVEQESNRTHDNTDILPQVQRNIEEDPPLIESNDLQLTTSSYQTMKENVSSNTKQISNIQCDIRKMLQGISAMENVVEEVHMMRQDVLSLQRNVSDVQKEISNMQRGLTFVYGRNNLRKKIGSDAN